MKTVARAPRICEYCGKRPNKDNKLTQINYGSVCWDCLSDNFVWCEICTEYFLADNHCRHVFWTDFGWRGSGGYRGDWDDHKESFFALLDETRMADDLLVELRACNVNLQLLIPLIGMETVLLRLNHKEYGDILTDAMLKAQEEQAPNEEDHRLMMGSHWLLSLQPGKTKEADDVTIRWIEEWKRLTWLKSRAR